MLTHSAVSVLRDSFHEIEYTIETATKHVVGPLQQKSCKSLVSIDSGTMTAMIPCLKCSPFEHFDQYSEHYRQLLFNLLLSSGNLRVPHFCADRITRDITRWILEPANVTHRCFNLLFTYTYSVKISLRPVIHPDGLIKKATSRSYVSDLIASRSDKYEGKWNCSDHECSICIDDIDKYHNSLTLPCLHMFHQTCIVRWLEKNHVCPLCRFEMPAESSRIES